MNTTTDTSNRPDNGQCPQVRVVAEGWTQCPHPVDHEGPCDLGEQR